MGKPTRFQQALTLASYVVVEALRTRFFTIVLSLLLICVGLAVFLGQIAIIESRGTQSGLIGAFLRLSAVYVTSLFVITSTVREFHDNTIYLWLSLPIPRHTYLWGKLLGFICITSIVVMLFGLFLVGLLLCGHPPYFQAIVQIVLWTISLWSELLIVTITSFLCVLTFQHTIQAVSAVLGFYILARSISAIQLMAEGPLHDAGSLADQFIYLMIQLIAILLPKLESFTQSSWLVYHTGTWEELFNIVVQTAVYLLLLTAMSLFDLYRKNF